jgi:hypothetical protein
VYRRFGKCCPKSISCLLGTPTVADCQHSFALRTEYF